MTDKLTDTLDIPSLKEALEKELVEEDEIVETAISTTVEAKSIFDTKEDIHDDEANDIIAKALDSYEEIILVGKNVNPEKSARIFEVAGQFLKISLEASNAKSDKYLKIAKLRLEARRLKIQDNTSDALNHGAEIMANRNDLLKQLLDESRENTLNIDPESVSDHNENDTN